MMPGLCRTIRLHQSIGAEMARPQPAPARAACKMALTRSRAATPRHPAQDASALWRQSRHSGAALPSLPRRGDRGTPLQSRPAVARRSVARGPQCVKGIDAGPFHPGFRDDARHQESAWPARFLRTGHSWKTALSEPLGKTGALLRNAGSTRPPFPRPWSGRIKPAECAQTSAARAPTSGSAPGTSPGLPPADS